jgi:hypothetical protein
MKNENKSTLKVLAGVVAIVLIGSMLFITNAFVGNPLSAMVANKSIQQYVGQNYAFLDIEVEKASYDFKNQGYRAIAKSKTSMDTRFAIYYSEGQVKRDDYQLYVVEKFNTLDRLIGEYSLIAKTIISNELGYENNTTYVVHDKDLSDKLGEILELDMKFDKAVPIGPEVSIQIDTVDYSLENVAKVLTDAHKAFLDNDCVFAKYGFYAGGDDTNIMVIGVTPEAIESGALLKLLTEAELSGDNGSEEGILIFRKGE